MTEAEWLECADLTPMLEFLQGKASDRKLRLFVCACCRRIWHLVTDERSRKAVEVAEQFADGQASKRKRMAAFEKAEDATTDVTSQGERVYFAAVAAGEVVEDEECDPYCGWYTVSTVASKSTVECRHHTEFVRDIFGNSFRPVTLNPTWLTPTVLSLAEAAYENRILPAGTLDNARLSVLADALEDAGCANADILNHCRQPGEHVRGCWVVDLMLGKE